MMRWLGIPVLALLTWQIVDLALREHVIDQGRKIANTEEELKRFRVVADISDIEHRRAHLKDRLRRFHALRAEQGGAACFVRAIEARLSSGELRFEALHEKSGTAWLWLSAPAAGEHVGRLVKDLRAWPGLSDVELRWTHALPAADGHVPFAIRMRVDYARTCGDR